MGNCKSGFVVLAIAAFGMLSNVRAEDKAPAHEHAGKGPNGGQLVEVVVTLPQPPLAVMERRSLNLHAAQSLSSESKRLKLEVEKFLDSVRAA